MRGAPPRTPQRTAREPQEPRACSATDEEKGESDGGWLVGQRLRPRPDRRDEERVDRGRLAQNPRPVPLLSQLVVSGGVEVRQQWREDLGGEGAKSGLNSLHPEVRARLRYLDFERGLGGRVTQRGEHPIALYVALRDPDRQTLAEWKDGTRKRSYSFRDNYETGVTIKPDTGVYTIEWMIARNEDDGTRDRQPSGSVESTFTFDSNADRLRQKLRIENAM